jgi:hypothetical protein
MIASQKIGKSFMGALGYNLKKLSHSDPLKRAELLDTNFSNLDKRQIAFEVDLVRELRPSLNNYVYHTSLNFHKDDKLNNELLLQIAQQYLEAMGFINNQYFIFRHHDAEHPHLHLLVNRITFESEVVSDSNNYKRSEEILRSIERQYNLVQVTKSQSSKVSSPTKDEIEKTARTGKASDKLVLQEIMKSLIAKSNNITDLITNGERAGVQFLFNQQSTGRISGITYFFRGFKITGQKLGNSFKWAELIKHVNYEQDRDCKAISEASSRTRIQYGELDKSTVQPTIRQGSDELHRGSTAGTTNEYRQQTANEKTGNEAFSDRKRSLEANQDADFPDNISVDFECNSSSYSYGLEIIDDVDDEAIYGKDRHRRKKVRTNRR